MTTPYLLADIRHDEGCVLHAYLDSVGVITIGVGHTGPEVHKGLVWTQKQADDQLAIDIGRAVGGLNVKIPWWRTLCDVRQDVLANMAFNLGVDGLLTFHNTLAHVHAHEWDEAKAGMLASKWASQVKGRATRLAEQMRTGVRA